MVLRGGVANPKRRLIDGELVMAILQDVEPTEAIAVPRAAVLADQEGDYVFVVAKDVTTEAQFKDAEAAAQQLGLQVMRLEVTTPENFPGVLDHAV